MKEIGEINFLDVKVKVYHDPFLIEHMLTCSWQARNPHTFYQGVLYMSPDGKITHPECTVIPEQNDEDREIIPKFFVIGHKEINDALRMSLVEYLESDYKRRNK